MTPPRKTLPPLHISVPARLLHGASLHAHWRTLLVVLVGAVAWLSFTPATGQPSFMHADKIAHALAFFALGVASALSWSPSHRVHARVAGALLAYGALIEVVQGTLPSRSADGLDWLADAAGVALGLWAVHAARSRWPLGRA